MADNEKIKATLAQLDPLDDDQWTADGAPKVETISALLGEKVTRQDIVNAEPDFNREKSGKVDEDHQDQQGSGDGTQQNDPNVTVDATDNNQDGEIDPPARDPVGLPKTFNQAEFQAWLNDQDREDLEQIAEDIREEQGRLSAHQEELKTASSALKTAAALVKLKINAAYPNTSDAEATRNYIEAQTRARAERIGIRQSVLKGLKPSELEGRSPLDAAMARKTTRGAARPNRPLMK